MRAGILADYPAVARELGLDPSAELAAVGLSLRLLAEPDLLVPADSAVRLLEQSADHADCPTLALRMAGRRQLAHFGVASLVLSQQRTVREALRVGFQFRHLLNEALAVYLEEIGDTAVIRAEVLTTTPMPAAQSNELGLAAIVQLIRAIIGPRWRPRALHVTHGAPSSLDEHRRRFGCPIEFGSLFNGISFPATDLDRANPAADPALATYAQGFLETLPTPAAGTAADVKRLIYLLLPMGKATIKTVAQILGRTVRTLQRELEHDGETYTSLLNAVRCEQAVRCLADRRVTLAHVATQLGYTSHGSFTRWFITEFGMPPTAWRADRIAHCGP